MLLTLTAAAAAVGYPGPKEVLMNVFEAFNRHDAIAIAGQYAEDAELISPDFCGVKIGPATVRENYAEYFKAFPDANDRVVSIIEDGDQAAVQFIFTGTINGRRIEQPIASFVTVRQGKIVRDVTYFDVEPTPKCGASR